MYCGYRGATVSVRVSAIVSVNVEQYQLSDKLKHKLGDKEYREAFVEEFYTDIRELVNQHTRSLAFLGVEQLEDGSLRLTSEYRRKMKILRERGEDMDA